MFIHNNSLTNTDEIAIPEMHDNYSNVINENLIEKGYKAVDDISAYLKERISTGEKSLIESIIKLSINVPKIPISRLPSVLFSVGKDTALKRKSRGKTKIKVQPDSQKRRVSKIGSQQKQSSEEK